LSGAAFSTDSFERASVIAVLQATNAFVAGDLEIPQSGRPSSGSVGPRDQSPQSPSDPSGLSDPPTPSDPSTPSDSSLPSDSSRLSEPPKASESARQSPRRSQSRPSDLARRSRSPRRSRPSRQTDSGATAPSPDVYVNEVLAKIRATTQRPERRRLRPPGDLSL
jgi:hypothetical protein